MDNENEQTAQMGQQSANNQTNPYEPQTVGLAISGQSADSRAALDRIMPAPRSLAPEPLLDPNAVHFAKGHPDTLISHIKEWIEWRLNRT